MMALTPAVTLVSLTAYRNLHYEFFTPPTAGRPGPSRQFAIEFTVQR